MLRYDIKELVGMYDYYRELLRELDEEAVEYMVEEQRKEIEELKSEKIQLNKEIEAKRQENEAGRQKIKASQQEIERLKTLLDKQQMQRIE